MISSRCLIRSSVLTRTGQDGHRHLNPGINVWHLLRLKWGKGAGVENDHLEKAALGRRSSFWTRIIPPASFRGVFFKNR
jgi:hypothetical protein